MTTELWPSLGSAGTPVAEGQPAGLEAVRITLLTELFEQKAGGLGGPAWVEAWDRVARETAGVVATEATRRLRDAAALSRFPAARLGARLPSGEDRRVLAARYQAAGIPIEHVAGANPTSGPRLAGALEEAWSRLELMVREDLAEWDRRAAEVGAWQRPWGPLLLWGLVAGAVALWIGLMLGGYLPVPAPLEPIVAWYWSLG